MSKLSMSVMKLESTSFGDTVVSTNDKAISASCPVKITTETAQITSPGRNLAVFRFIRRVVNAANRRSYLKQ
jgi:hypothetical protein